MKQECENMEFLKIILTAFSSLIVLFLLTKIMGNRQVSELTMFDYVIGISIGSIAAEMATNLDKPENCVVAMAVYALFSVVISFITSKSIIFRRIFFGRTVELMKKGEIIRKNLRKTHLDLSEFLMQARTAGYFDISQIDTALMEPNGKISFLPFSNARPVNADDLKIVPNNDEIFLNVICDGNLIEGNLGELGYSKAWLFSELKTKGIKDFSKIFLATLNKDGVLNVFE